MRLFKMILCLSLGISNVAFATETAAENIPAVGAEPESVRAAQPADRELMIALRDLNIRHRIAENNTAAGIGLFTTTATGLVGMVLATADLSKFRGLADINKNLLIGSAIAFSTMAIFVMGSEFQDRMQYDAQARVLNWKDKKALSYLAIDAFRQFFKRPLDEQYILASENPALRTYLIQLQHWMQYGVMNGQPPALLAN